MLARLDAARLQSAKSEGGADFDDAGADRLYREAFAWYGLDAERGPAAATAVRAAGIRAVLVSALDDWARVQTNLQKHPTLLRRLANQADDQPWQVRLREALARADR